MVKNYTTPFLNEEKLVPSSETISFLLAFSKSLTYLKSVKLKDKIQVNLN